MILACSLVEGFVVVMIGVFIGVAAMCILAMADGS